MSASAWIEGISDDVLDKGICDADFVGPLGGRIRGGALILPRKNIVRLKHYDEKGIRLEEKRPPDF